MVICFYCWKLIKLIKINDAEPMKKEYYDKYDYVGAADLLKDHWNHSCAVTRTKDGYARLIQKQKLQEETHFIFQKSLEGSEK